MSANFALLIEERRLAEALAWWREWGHVWREWAGHKACNHIDVLAAAAAERLREGEADR